MGTLRGGHSLSLLGGTLITRAYLKYERFRPCHTLGFMLVKHRDISLYQRDVELDGTRVHVHTLSH